jgi:hypothetical protein
MTSLNLPPIAIVYSIMRYLRVTEVFTGMKSFHSLSLKLLHLNGAMQLRYHSLLSSFSFYIRCYQMFRSYQ